MNKITWYDQSGVSPRFTGVCGDIRAWVGRRKVWTWGAGIEISRHVPGQAIEVLHREAFNVDAYGWDAARARAEELMAQQRKLS